MRREISPVTALWLLIAATASAGSFVAVPDVMEPESEAPKTEAVFRIANSHSACGTVFWSFGGWCEGDEVTAYFDLPNDPRLRCSWWGHFRVVSAEVEFRVVGTTCNGGYPVTTYAFEGQYILYQMDPAVSSPDCPFPAQEPLCYSVVATVPALTATSSTDPARTYTHTFDFDWLCYWPFLDPQPLFGAFRWMSFSVPESTLSYCGQGGLSSCAWWYPGMRGRNGQISQAPCAAPCTQYYRNESLIGPQWYESLDAGLGRVTDFAHWLNVDLVWCNPVSVQTTTWGKLKSLMNR